MAPTSFLDSVHSRSQARHRKTVICVGIDPGSTLKITSNKSCYVEDLWRISNEIITETQGCTDCFKPNAAFFEASGSAGFAVLERVCRELHSSCIPFILDVKRNDIPNTCEASASMAFEHLNSDAITMNPFFGESSIKAFACHPSAAGKTVFVVCKTSNTGGFGELQVEVPSDNNNKSFISKPLYQHIACLCDNLNKKKKEEEHIKADIGVVVGATCSAAISALRKSHPHLWILAPGIGAQGGNLQNVLQNGRGECLIVSASRSIAVQMKDSILKFERNILEIEEKLL